MRRLSVQGLSYLRYHLLSVFCKTAVNPPDSELDLFTAFALVYLELSDLVMD
jgi:hypothetical protein